MRCQGAGHVGADVTDAQAEEDPGQAAVARLVDLGHDLGGDGLAHHDVIAVHGLPAAGHLGQGLLREAVIEVRDVRDEARGHELADELVSQAVDVHGLAAHPVA